KAIAACVLGGISLLGGSGTVIGAILGAYFLTQIDSVLVLLRIAWFYYHDGLTQSEISERLGLTRLKVSRLLEKGHQSGIIRV
ncbi:hypothetical protein KU735_23450, partial [Salmonella enterica subsp. enterica serovar Give]|nr:hypothetical protein [Salmonella enterica subsp. enterica serovar Give]